MKTHYWHGDIEDAGGLYPRTSCRPKGARVNGDGFTNLTDDWEKVTCSACLARRRSGESRTERYFKVCPNCGFGKNPRLI
jgi:hypothetical protein